MKLQGKVAIITGSSRGIGKAIALRFAQEGARVVVNYKSSPDAAENVVSEIQAMGQEAVAVRCDVSKEDQVKKLVSETVAAFGKVDILVNNAGIVYDVPLFEKTVEEWSETINVNLIGTFLCSKYVSEDMKLRNSGVIINISSTNGIDTISPSSADYDATKAGVISLTRNLAEELGPENVRVNAIAPGWVDTDMNEDLPEDFVEDEKKKTIMRRFGKPEEIASVAAFLASDDASFITRSVLRVDGGYI